MNTTVTSREAILKTCRKLVSEEGISSLNMRAVAKACGVALGSLYYYFPSKNDLLIAAIESVWEDIFRLGEENEGEEPFPKHIESCFMRIQSGIHRYPHFFTVHTISVSTNGQTKARSTMDRYLTKIKEGMVGSLRADKNIDRGVFSQEFTEENFVDFIMSNIIYLFMQRKEDCKTLVQVIERIIY